MRSEYKEHEKNSSHYILVVFTQNYFLVQSTTQPAFASSTGVITCQDRIVGIFRNFWYSYGLFCGIFRSKIISCENAQNPITLPPIWRLMYQEGLHPYWIRFAQESFRDQLRGNSFISSVHKGCTCMAGVLCIAGVMHGRGCVWQGACLAGETTTTADGTHLTGMHSCF